MLQYNITKLEIDINDVITYEAMIEIIDSSLKNQNEITERLLCIYCLYFTYNNLNRIPYIEYMYGHNIHRTIRDAIIRYKASNKEKIDHFYNNIESCFTEWCKLWFRKIIYILRNVESDISNYNFNYMFFHPLLESIIWTYPNINDWELNSYVCPRIYCDLNDKGGFISARL